MDTRFNPNLGSGGTILPPPSVNKNCLQKKKTIHGSDMKVAPVTKLDNRRTAASKNIDNRVVLVNCDIIVFSNLWPICSHLEAGFIDAWSIKRTFSLIATFYLSLKIELKIISNTVLILLL